VLGSVLILENQSNLEASLGAKGVPKAQADAVASCVSSGGESACQAIGEKAGAAAGKLFSTVPQDFALATRTVFYAFAGVMAVAFVVALVAMPAGKVTEPPAEDEAERTPAGAA
jgi:hypothetical protein